MFPLVLGIQVCDGGIVNSRWRKISCFPSLSEGERRRAAEGPLAAGREGCCVAEVWGWRRGWREAALAHWRQDLCQIRTVLFELNHSRVWTWGKILAWLQFRNVAFRTSNFFLSPSLTRCLEEATKYDSLSGYVCSVGVQPVWPDLNRDPTQTCPPPAPGVRGVTSVMQWSRLLLNDLLCWTLIAQLSFAPAGPSLFLTTVLTALLISHGHLRAQWRNLPDAPNLHGGYCLLVSLISDFFWW